MNSEVLTQVRDVKIPFWRKLCFGGSGFARMLASSLISAYAVYYYTDVLGLNGKLVGLIILISKVWDFINDPMMGALVDRTHSKEGKCRFWLKFFSVPGGIVLAMMFMVPELSASGQLIWFAVTYILQAMFHTVLCIPTNALLGRITSNQKERRITNQISLLCSTTASYTLTAVALPLVEFFGGEDMRKGFIGLAIVCGVLYAGGFLLAAIGTAGYEPLEFMTESTQDMQKGAPKSSLGDSIKALFSNSYWLCAAGIALFSVMGELTSVSSIVQHFQYNLHDTGLMATFSLISMVTGYLGILTYSFLTKRFGNAGTAFIGSIIGAAGWMFRFIFADANATIFVVGFSVAMIGSCWTSSVNILCLLDSRVYGEWKTGVDNDAILMSGHTTASKIGMAVGPAVGAMMLDVVGYVPQAEEQVQAVKTLFLVENTLLVAICYILVAVCSFLMISKEKKLPQMRAELEARKAAL